MRKRIVIALFLSIVSCQLLNVAIAHAQTATNSPQTNRDRLKNLKEERLQLISETRGELKEKMEAFKAQIRTIRDEKKQIITERVADKVASSNARLTNRMDSALDHLTEILARVKTQSQDFKTQGKDTTALDNAITAAENAIAAAQTAVDTQETKEYTANITDESALKNTIGKMVSQFRLDIQAVHKLVVDAKQAVMKAIMEAAKLKGRDNTATGSANI